MEDINKEIAGNAMEQHEATVQHERSEEHTSELQSQR